MFVRRLSTISVGTVAAVALGLGPASAHFCYINNMTPQAMAGAVWAVARGEKRGGSTITQQLAKNLYKTRRGETGGAFGHIPVANTLISKTKEWLTAVELERRYTKEEILRMYFNTVEYGSQAFGIKVAAKTFSVPRPIA